MNLLVLKVKCADPSDLRLDVKGFGISLAKHITAHGGKCVLRWADETLTILIQECEKTAVDELINVFAEGWRKEKRHAEITMTENVTPDAFVLPDNYSGPDALRREKLTKKFLFSLPTGVFVVSNLYPNRRSAFAEKIGTLETRLAAWNRAVAAGATQRLCQVLNSEDEFIRAASPVFA